MGDRYKAPWHRGTYHVRARACRQMAYANPATRCWRCGLTFAEYAGLHGTGPAKWQAGHVIDKQVDGELRPEHARCNAQAGNRSRNRRSEDPYR